MATVIGNVVGGIIRTPDAFIIQDEEGNEYPAVMVSEETVFTADIDDIREGKTAAIERGVVTGNRVIPAYHTYQGSKLIPAGSSLKISILSTLDLYDYTQLQSIICAFNTNINDSVSAVRVTIGDNVYNVGSAESVSSIIKNHTDKTIELGLINDTGNPLIIRFFTYKEVL